MDGATQVSYISALQTEQCGFDLEDRHNRAHAKLGLDVQSKAHKTGTTICGVKCKDGVVLASDTRATMGTVVADKNCQKLHHLTDNIWCAGAGTAADLFHVTEQLATDMKLFSMQTKRLPRVQTCVARLTQELFKYQGYVSVALILGGVDPTGVHLQYVSMTGYTHALPYIAMGSGGYFAMAMLEAGYKEDMTMDQAAELAADAIQAGVTNDLGSGTHVDIVKIRADAATSPILIRPFRRPVAHLIQPMKPQIFPVGTTTVLSTTRKPMPRRLEELIADTLNTEDNTMGDS